MVAGLAKGGQNVRARLIDAAYSLVGLRGLDGCTLRDILAVAEVGPGSFYYHFTSKEELAREAFRVRTEDYLNGVINMITSADPMASMCYCHRSIIEQAERDPLWGAFMIDMEPRTETIGGLLREYGRIAVEKIAPTNIKVKNLDIAISLSLSLSMSITTRMLRGEVSSKEAHETSIYGLRLFGIADREASEVANLSMEQLRMRLVARRKRHAT